MGALLLPLLDPRVWAAIALVGGGIWLVTHFEHAGYERRSRELAEATAAINKRNAELDAKATRMRDEIARQVAAELEAAQRAAWKTECVIPEDFAKAAKGGR